MLVAIFTASEQVLNRDNIWKVWKCANHLSRIDIGCESVVVVSVFLGKCTWQKTLLKPTWVILLGAHSLLYIPRRRGERKCHLHN